MSAPLADAARPQAVLIGTVATLKALTEFALTLQTSHQVLLLVQHTAGTALKLRPSTLIVPGMPPHAIAAIAELTALGLASRVASDEDLPGCFEGSVTELLDTWLEAGQVGAQGLAICVCGDDALCERTRVVAERHGLAVQQTPGR